MSWSKTAPIKFSYYWWRTGPNEPSEILEVQTDGTIWYCGIWTPAKSMGGEWWSEPIKEPT